MGNGTMAARTTVRRHGRVAFGAVVVLVSVTGVVVGTAMANAGEPEPRFSMNANGDTYGSAMDSVDPAHEPDLVLVVATNGREGYVYGTDLEPPELQPANPDEAGALRRAQEAKAAAAFVQVLSDELGLTIDVSDERSVAALGLFDRRVVAGLAPAAADEGAIGRLGDALGVDLAAVGGDTATVADAVQRAVDAASHANQRVIPVYESDGVTQIGTFTVG